MKNKGIISAFALLAAVVVSSCSTSNDVVSNRKIQKRKYTKGFHVNDKNMSASIKKNKDSNTIDYKSEEVLVNEEENISAAINKVNNEISNIESTQKVVNTIIESNDLDVNSNVNTASTVVEYGNEEVLSEKGENTFVVDVKDNSKQINSKSKTTATPAAESGAMLVLLIILALFLPPVAIAIYQGITSWFWIDLLLFVLAIGGWFLLGGLSGLAGLAAVIIAFLVIFDVI